MSFSRSYIPFLRRCLFENSLKPSLTAVPRRLKGHSHWQNTRHAKAIADAHKGTTTMRHVRVIEAAVAVGGGTDTRFNLLLANAIESAKRTQVVSNAAIEAAIKRASDPTLKKATTEQLYEFFGDKGALALASVETGNASKLKHDLKTICRRHQWAIAKAGVKERFVQQYYVIVSGKKDGSTIDSDELLAVGIEGGAEDMEEIGEGSNKMFEFICAPGTHFALSKILQQADYTISDIGKKWVPQVAVEIEEEYAKKVGEFCDALEEHPEITGVYTNLS